MIPKTVDQLIAEMHDAKSERVKSLMKTCTDILFDKTHPNWAEIQPGAPDGHGRTTYPGGAPMTFCNQYVYLVFMALQYAWKKYFQNSRHTGLPDRLWTALNYFADKAKQFGYKVTWQQAQQLANMGGFCIAVDRENLAMSNYGHIGIVYPTEFPVQTESDVMIANAGSRAVYGVKTCEDCFLKWKIIPEYYYIPKA